jgi:hypothetical protein
VAEVSGRAELAHIAVGDARVVTRVGSIDVDVLRTGTLVVHDATDRARYEREVHTVRPAVAAGTSGAPVVDEAGRVLGIVVLANRADDWSYAVTSAEIGASRPPRDDSAGGPPGGVRHADHPCPD